MPYAEVPIPTSEVHYLEQVVGTFVAWLTHLVREVTNEVSFFSPMNLFYLLTCIITCTLISIIIGGRRTR